MLVSKTKPTRSTTVTVIYIVHYREKLDHWFCRARTSLSLYHFHPLSHTLQIEPSTVWPNGMEGEKVNPEVLKPYKRKELRFEMQSNTQTITLYQYSLFL